MAADIEDRDIEILRDTASSPAPTGYLYVMVLYIGGHVDSLFGDTKGISDRPLVIRMKVH